MKVEPISTRAAQLEAPQDSVAAWARNYLNARKTYYSQTSPSNREAALRRLTVAHSRLVELGVVEAGSPKAADVTDVERLLVSTGRGR